MIHLTIDEVLTLSTEKMRRHGVPEQEAEIAAPIFLEGELWGKRTHGFRYLETCLVQYQLGATRRQEMRIEGTTANSALVNGGFHFPFVVHYTAMQLAMEIAEVRGMAVVGVRNSGVSGLLGYYSQMATEAGLIGIAFNSAVAAVVAPGGVTPLLSTNPLTIGIPRLDHPPLILDMATSAGTYSQVMVAQRDHALLPAGIAVDPEGQPTTDPFKAVDEAHHTRLLPFGGYKGFGLALMIELLCSAGLGTPIGTQKLTLSLDPASCNGLYFVFRPDLFVEREVFDAQVTQLLADLESSTPAKSSVMRFPGEASQRRKTELLSRGIIDLEEPTYAFLTDARAPVPFAREQGLAQPFRSGGIR
jgi:LDH2 family malate/lactate/ureidoglycolate dehydrogenase